jgi:Icc-related predicted phosphoesterase
MFAAATALILAGCGGDAGTTTTDASTTTSVMATTTSSTMAATTTTSSATTTTFGDRDADALLVIGDWGSGTLPQGAVAGAMMRYAEGNAVEAILTTGDNFYSDDAEFIMHPFGWAIEAEIPFWITWGNHDLDTPDRIAAIDEVFDDPPRWTTHRWGNVLVVILDSTQPDSDHQIDFLTQTLADTDLPTIVVFHHPPYSCGLYGHDEIIQQNWVTRFDEEVFLVLSGHEHNYQRFEDSGTTYVVTGGGGAALTELRDCPTDGPEAVAAESTHHFLILDQGDDVTVSVVETGGDLVDEFEVPLP